MVYEIPASVKPILGEKKVIALELLDSIFNKALNMRLFEPKITIQEEPQVKLVHKEGEENGSSNVCY